MYRFAIDLTWVRHNCVGGTEFSTQRILKGMTETTDDFCAYLIVSKDNANLFEKYQKDRRFVLVIGNFHNGNVYSRVMWQNFHLGSVCRNHHLTVCFEPVHAKPFLNNHSVRYVTVIRDLQALHFPNEQSLIKCIFLRMSWFFGCRTSYQLITISEHCKQDILSHYKVRNNRVVVINNPLDSVIAEPTVFSTIQEQYGVEQGKYYFTVSRLDKNKNLDTLFRVMARIKADKTDLPQRLVVAGSGIKGRPQIIQLVEEMGLSNEIIIANYLSAGDMNALYKASRAFLFPSIFEGFGNPLIEAFSMGTTVITTSCSCMPEITQGKANYVTDPYSVDEWITAMKNATNRSSEFDRSKYAAKRIAEEYLKEIKRACTTK